MPKNKGGRPPHEPTKETRTQVGLLAAFGNTEEQIAQVMGFTEKTLRRHYGEELKSGHLVAHYKVALNLFRQATKDDPKSVRAAEFWLKARCGWNDRPVSERGDGVDEEERDPGKKAAALARAREIAASASKFAPPPPPKLVVNNES